MIRRIVLKTRSLKQGTFFYSMAKFTPPTYGSYEYPVWGVIIGWCLALSSMLFIPGYAIYLMLVTEGTVKEVC